MANICSNEFWACSTNRQNIQTVLDYFNNNEDRFDSEVTDNGDQADIYFNSRWEFPEKEMNELYESLPDKEDIYMRCLSVEYGCMYHALWECDKNGWREV